MCERLPRHVKTELAIPIVLSTVFDRLLLTDRLHPLAFLEEVLSVAQTPEQELGLLGRALRSFPSFLRERDLGEEIERQLGLHLQNHVHLTRSEADDLKGKGDWVLRDERAQTLLTVHSYLVSDRSTYHLLQRLQGQRGELPSGLHLLCPFQAGIGHTLHGWHLYSPRQISAIGEAMTHPQPFDEFLHACINNTCYLEKPALILKT